ncbi:MAG: DUF4328 domain-containing protein [Sedimentisphaerales bacterium]|nr:DUF4328 domain-containing protein [Sedimentisphaerales bacterium]
MLRRENVQQTKPVISCDPDRFKDPRKLGLMLKMSAGLFILVCLFAISTDWSELTLLKNIQLENFETREELEIAAENNDMAQIKVALGYLAAGVTTFIVFLFWIYRVKYNVIQLGAQDLEFTPGWSVGWFFVPVLFLWKPYQAMQETFKASRNPGNWKGRPGSILIGCWWACWILGIVLWKVSNGLGNSNDLSILIRSTQVSIAAEVCTIIEYILTLMVATQIESMQMYHFKQICNAPPGSGITQPREVAPEQESVLSILNV